jgi:protein-S-isoprenylcysteine O-methyltransferase Ste14
MALCGLGYMLIFLSGVALGRQYSQEVTIQKDHKLITKGVFHYIRNPRYSGVMNVGIGLSLLFRSWVGLIICFGLIIILLFRIEDEEALLKNEFGQEWENYCKTSWRLIPFLY